MPVGTLVDLFQQWFDVGFEKKTKNKNDMVNTEWLVNKKWLQGPGGRSQTGPPGAGLARYAIV